MMLAVAVVAAPPDKSGVSPNTISLPKGPGSIEGLGDSFQPTLNTGTAKYAVSFKAPPGTSGLVPLLALSYDAGGASGPYGWGWSLGTPSVQRQTDKGIPLYSDPLGVVLGRSDRFVNEAREELVPVGDGFHFCKNETAFLRYRSVGDHWEAHRPDGSRLIFGATSAARVQDRSQPDRVFEWLLEQEIDLHGNTILYKYQEFTGQSDLNRKYLSEVRYGAGAPPWSSFQSVVFRYDRRSDVIEDGRPGFLVRTGHRLTEVLVLTQGASVPALHATGDRNGDGQADALVRRYVLEYLLETKVPSRGSYLHRVRQFGADISSELPPLTLEYQVAPLPMVVSASDRWLTSTNLPPTLMDSANADFVDLNGDGLPDILRTLGNGVGQLAHEGWLNRGKTSCGIAWEKVIMGGDVQAFTVGLQTNVTHLADMDGDGLSDWVIKGDSGQVRYFPNGAHSDWRPSRAMAATDFPPPAPFGEADVRVADVDFDKRSDIVRTLTGGQGVQYWLNLGGGTYSRAINQELDGGSGFEFWMDGTDLADVNGDRVADLVRIQPGGVSIALGYGYGRFAESKFLPLEGFPDDEGALRRAKMLDVTSDGLADLVIERAVPGEMWYWVNLSNGTFDERRKVTGLPVPESGEVAVRWADINGNGTSDLVYAESRGGPRLIAVDVGELIGCGVGHGLLNAVANGIGRVSRIRYQASTEFRLADEAEGKPWPHVMPFPVTVVAEVEMSDSLGHRYRSEFRYHDGFYDPEEKQFRGFARVEQEDFGDATAPNLITRSYFDTGKDQEVMKGKLLRLTVETKDGQQFTDETTGWIVPPIGLYSGRDERSVSYVHPTNQVRNVLELGQGSPRRLETEMEYDRFGNVTANRNFGIVENGDRSAFDDERFTRTDYAINTNAWILRAVARMMVSDETGTNVISRSESFYDDPTFSGSNFGQVTRGDLTLKLDWSHPATLGSPTNPPPIRSARTRYDTYGNPVLILDPLAEPKTGDPDLSKGHARELAYDPRFHAFPEREVIHLGEGKEPLVFQAKYDEGFGTVLESTDFNGNATRYGYDVFGRLTSIVRPGDTEAFPTAEYSYALAVPYLGTNLVNYVETRQLDKTNRVVAAKRDSYLIAREFVDGLGRKLISKQEATEAGGPARVSVKGAVRFNARQKPAEALNPFYSSLTGTLDEQLAFESIEAPGWTGQFALSNALVTLNLASAHRSRTTYDATLRELTVTNPDGTTRRTVYEPLLTRSFDENDNDTNSPYAGTPMVHHNDGLGRLVRVDEISRLSDDGMATNALQAWTTRYAYDLNDQLTHIRDSQNNQKWFQYDGLKRKTFMNDPDRGVMKFEYDDASNLLATEDAKGQRIRYTYDGANRIRTEDYLDEGQPFSRNFAFNPSQPVSATNRGDVVYFYDTPLAHLDVGDGTFATATNLKGKLAYVWDLSGEEHTSHDARDRVAWVVKRVRDPLHGQLVSYRTGFDYDALDRLTSLIYPDNDAIGYRYNDRSLLQTITGGPAGSIISNLVYLPSDQQGEILYGNGIRTGYAYDSRLRLSSLVTAPRANPAAPFIAFDYVFDGVSNIRSITDQRPGTVVPAGDKRRNTQLFQYDDLYRLTRVQYSFSLPASSPSPLGGERGGVRAESVSNDGEINYRYDRIGNMLAQTSSITDTDPRNGLPVANLGTMDSGGTAGRFNRTGRTANDPPGPHALTSLHAPGSPLRAFPYDHNGNMTELDGMVATWDFKDRLVALEDATMRAAYAYDFTDRRITKRVTKKRPLATTGGEGVKYSFTTLYVGKHFEVREFDAPTKFVFNGNTRVARVTGTLSPNERVQRLRVHAGWNLLSVAVTALNGGRQLSLSAGGEGQGEVVVEAYRWNPDTRTFGAVSPTDTLPAGSVLWVKASADATLRVTGAYPGPRPNLRGPPEGDFLPGYGLEAWPTSAFDPQHSLSLWRFSPDTQGWQTKVSLPDLTFSDLPAVLAPHEAVYAQAPAPVDLEVPAPALSLRFYHQDHIGSSSVMSDAAGALVEESASFPFGSSRGQFRPRGIREDYQFTQKERDAESGMNYYECRFQTSELNRFISPDPLTKLTLGHWLRNPQRASVYAYCMNRPLVMIDPSGLDPAYVDLPSFADMQTAYPDKHEMTRDDLAKDIGGNVEKNFTSGDPAWENTCALRMSKMFNDLGISLPKPGTDSSLETISGSPAPGSGEKSGFAFRRAELGNWIEAKLGAPDLQIDMRSAKVDSSGIPTQLKGREGLISFAVSGWSDASGHLDLINSGGKCATECYFQPHLDAGATASGRSPARLTEIKFWEAGKAVSPTPSPGP
jgi:RHS repeat-associated protein